MPDCVIINPNGYIQTVDPQPSDLTQCQLVILTPSEFSQASQIADPVQAATLFAFGFATIFGSYLTALAVRQVREAVRSARH